MPDPYLLNYVQGQRVLAKRRTVWMRATVIESQIGRDHIVVQFEDGTTKSYHQDTEDVEIVTNQRRYTQGWH